MHRGTKSGKCAPPGYHATCDACGWCRTLVLAETTDDKVFNMCEPCFLRWLDVRGGGRWRPTDEVLYRVDLAGPFAKLTAGWLTGMVKCTCRRCGVPLLAEGRAHRRAARLAEGSRRQLVAVCGPCLRAVTGAPPRGVADDVAHQAEFAAAADELDATVN
jgi:hypothetical protein